MSSVGKEEASIESTKALGAMTRSSLNEEERKVRCIESGWGDFWDAAVGSVVFATACGPLTAFADADTASNRDLQSPLWYTSAGTKVEEVNEEVGTSPEQDTIRFDYIEQEYDVRDLAQDVNSRSRGFTKNEADDYQNFLDSIFE